MLNVTPVPLDSFDADGFKNVYMLDVILSGGTPFSLGMGSQFVSDKIGGSETIADAVRRVVTGGGGKQEKFEKPKPNEKSPKKPNKMSFRCKKACHIIYRLPANSGLRYALGHAPILRDPVIADGIFGNPQYVDSSGNILPPGSAPNDCRHLLIAYDGKKAAPPAGDDFIGTFNLYVDVLDDPKDVTGGHIPIVLDPDARWPGGSGSKDGGDLIDVI